MYSVVITSEVRGTEKYLVIQCEQTDRINDYLLKMLEYNSITGILPLKSQWMNGKTILYYPVGNCYPIMDLIKNKQIGEKETQLIFKRLVKSIETMGEYFLNADQCVYEVEYLYVDRTLNPYLMYIPVESGIHADIMKVWKEFFLNLLSYIADGKQDTYYSKMMWYLVQPNFELNEFKNFLTNGDAEEDIDIVSVQEQMKQEKAIKDEREMLNKKRDEPPTSGQKKFSGGIPVPGEAPSSREFPIPEKVSIVQGNRNNKEKEKKESWLKFGKKKKEKEEVTEVQDTPVKFQKPGKEQEQKKESEAKCDINANNANKWEKTIQINVVPNDVEKTMMLSNVQSSHLLHNGALIPLVKFPFTIGKASASYIVANQSVSRLHATITWNGREYYVKDEGSSNGSWLNKERLTPHQQKQIQDGDELVLSNEVFVFHIK